MPSPPQRSLPIGLLVLLAIAAVLYGLMLANALSLPSGGEAGIEAAIGALFLTAGLWIVLAIMIVVGATMGAMSAAALSKASHAGEDLTAKLRDAELQASYRSAEHMGFDELIDPRETRDALIASLQRGLSSRQAAAEPVSRTVIMP